MGIIHMENQKLCEELKQSYIDEMKDILFEESIVWDDNYVNIKDYTTNFDFAQEDKKKEFYMFLGKYLAIDEIQKRL